MKNTKRAPVIPKSIRVGTWRYRVERPKAHGTYGRIWYVRNIIEVAQTTSLGTVRSANQQEDTFWHEMTHAVLYEMGHKLYSDEVFVEAFSKRLSRAIRSAKF